MGHLGRCACTAASKRGLQFIFLDQDQDLDLDLDIGPGHFPRPRPRYGTWTISYP